MARDILLGKHREKSVNDLDAYTFVVWMLSVLTFARSSDVFLEMRKYPLHSLKRSVVQVTKLGQSF